MTATAWARATLQRGSSAGQIWEISNEYPEARLTLGADPGAGWCIDANGVKPVHAELFWDGNALWVADVAGVGGLFLDGERVSDWTQVHGPAELRFGQASLDIETSAPLEQLMQSRPELARPVTIADGVSFPASGSATFGGAAGDASVPGLDPEKTLLAQPQALPAEPMRIGVPTPPPEVSSALRPRLGGRTEPAATPHSPAATRMVALPGARPGGPPPPPPKLGGAPSPVVAPPPPGRAVPPPPPPPPPGRVSESVPPPPATETVPDVTPAPTDPGPVTPSPGGSAFAPPPAPSADSPPSKPGFFARLFGGDKKDEESTEEKGSKQALPMRTWILLSITVVAAMALLLWEEDPPPTPPPPADSNGPVVDVGTPSETGPEETPEETPEQTPEETPEQTPEESPPGTEPGEGDPPTMAEAEREPSSDDPEESDEPADVNEDGVSYQRVAADAYLAGRYEDALVAYRRLVGLFPDDDAYAAMVSLLERRLAAECQNGRLPGGAPCDTTP